MFSVESIKKSFVCNNWTPVARAKKCWDHLGSWRFLRVVRTFLDDTILRKFFPLIFAVFLLDSILISIYIVVIE